MKRIVIDASVVLKWYLPDEEHGDRALDILDGHASERFSLLAPALLEFEVANGLVMARRRGRVGEGALSKAMEGFADLGIVFHPISPHFQQVLAYCERYRISAYDAAYVALADGLNIHLVTADKRLFNAIGKLKCVKWIGEFRPQASR